MEENKYKDFWAFLKLLSDNDLLKYVVVVGSWAEYLYEQAGVLQSFQANLRTLDVDFLVSNMRRPDPPVSVTALAREAGYVIDSDILLGTTKIYTPGFMEIEFLILQRGAGDMPVLKTNLGVNAQALRHMSMLTSDSISVNMFGMSITVPSPEAYAIHKLVINRQRGGKAEKDQEALKNIIPHLNFDKMNALYSTLSKKERKDADYTCDIIGLTHFGK